MSEEEIRKEIGDFRKFVTVEFLSLSKSVGGIDQHLTELNTYNEHCQKNTRTLFGKARDNEKAIGEVAKGFEGCRSEHEDIADSKEKKDDKRTMKIAVGTSVLIGIFIIANIIINWIF